MDGLLSLRSQDAYIYSRPCCLSWGNGHPMVKFSFGLVGILIGSQGLVTRRIQKIGRVPAPAMMPVTARKTLESLSLDNMIDPKGLRPRLFLQGSITATFKHIPCRS